MSGHFIRRSGVFFICLPLVLLIFTNAAKAQSRLIISQYIESLGRTPKGIELWNPTDTPVDFSVDTLIILLGRNGDSLSTNKTIESGILAAGSVMVIGPDTMGTYLKDQGLDDVLFVDKGFNFNGDDALQIRLGGKIEDTFGMPVQDPGSAWSDDSVSTANSNIALKPGITTGDPDGFTDPGGRFYTISTDNSLTGFGIPPTQRTAPPGPRPEPSESAAFGKPDVRGHSITLHWTGAGGEIPPDGYLLKCSDTGFASIADPADGVPENDDSDLSDGTGAVTTGPGINQYTWTNLRQKKTYYFKIYSFTNSGSHINYKIDRYDSINVEAIETPVSNTVPKAWINEIHYDNASTDTAEFVEIAVDTAVHPLSSLEADLYNGNNGETYDSATLAGFTPGERVGAYRFYSKRYSSIQNGPDGVVLVWHSGGKDSLLEFLSYEGIFTGSEGAADNVMSHKIDVEEGNDTEVGRSIGLAGIPSHGKDSSVWIKMPATPGRLNDRESIFLKKDSLTSRAVITGDTGWRMLSCPVFGLTFSELQSETPIQGFPGAHPGSEKNLYSGYNGTQWSPPANLSQKIKNGHGFILYFFNNAEAGSRKLPIDFNFTGKMPDADVTVPLHSDGDEFNLIGNPFPTFVNMNDLLVSGGRLASKVAQIWDARSGSYLLSTEQDDRIAPGQGFFIQNNDAVSVTFVSNISIKQKEVAMAQKRVADDHALIGFELLQEEDGGGDDVLDRAAVLYFSNTAGMTWDQWDVQKLTPLRKNYTSLGIREFRDDKPVLQAEKSQPLNFSKPLKVDLAVYGPGSSGEKILRWPVWTNIPKSWQVRLKDLQTDQIIDMTTDSLYRFTISKSSETKKGDKVKISDSDKLTGKAIPDARFEVIITPMVAGTEEISDEPAQIRLSQNYPNPFNPSTEIRFFLPRAEQVSLIVYDVLGRKVATLAKGRFASGWHRSVWDAGRMASGVYFYRFKTRDKVIVRKMLLLK